MTACEEVRLDLRAAERGQLPAARHEALRAHLATCASCAAAERAERALTEALERRLPVHPASLSLKRRLAGRWLPEAPPPRPPVDRRRRRAVGAAAVLTVALVALLLLRRGAGPDDVLVAEAINHHLRLLDGERPLEVRSTDFHQVKPWFAGHVDFAPAITYTGDADYELEGGAVSRFLDARAASLVFRRRLHKITLFIMPATGPAWGRVADVKRAGARGFTVLLWRRADMAYALVSDLPAGELLELERRIAAAP